MFGKLWLVTMVLVILSATLIPALAQDQSASTNANEQPATATPQPALTASTGLFVSSLFRVNVRSGPGTEYTIIGKLNPADRVDITGQNNEAGDWLRVNFNGQEGWVSANVVDVTGDTTTAPIVEAAASAVLRGGLLSAQNEQGQPDAAGTGDVVVITRFNTNLRKDASLASDKIVTIPFNTQLRVEGRSENNNWVRVTFDGQTGWISAGLLFFASGKLDNLPAFDAQGNVIQPTTDQTQAQSGQ